MSFSKLAAHCFGDVNMVYYDFIVLSTSEQMKMLKFCLYLNFVNVITGSHMRMHG